MEEFPDLINAFFAFLCGLLLWNNVRLLWKQKKVRGISILSIFMFTLWGYWNLFYYPFLGQWASFFAGAVIVLANTAWVALAIKYRKN